MINICCREPAQNLADNLLRDFEERWWTICRKVSLTFLQSRLFTLQQARQNSHVLQGETEAMKAMLSRGAKLLATTVNENRQR